MLRFNALLSQPELNALNAHKLETQSAQNIWEAIAPEGLAKLCHAAAIKDQQLTLYTDSNAVAAKVKLFIPSLLIKLENQECEVTAIRVKVQVKSTPRTKPKIIKKLSRQAALDLNTLANKLSGTALGDALAKLAAKAD